MQQDRLAELVEDPELHRRLLGDYDGAYSLGITLNPEDRSELAIRVRIEGEDASLIAREVELDGELIPVVVNTGFQSPVPFFR